MTATVVGLPAPPRQKFVVTQSASRVGGMQIDPFAVAASGGFHAKRVLLHRSYSSEGHAGDTFIYLVQLRGRYGKFTGCFRQFKGHAGNLAAELYRWLETMRGSGVGIVFGRA